MSQLLYQDQDWLNSVDSAEREHKRKARGNASGRFNGPAGQEAEGEAWVDEIDRGCQGGVGVRNF